MDRPNIPHRDGSRECQPVLPCDPVEAALARYEEAKRWRAEKNADAQQALHEFGVAAVQEEQARVAYLAACTALHRSQEARADAGA